MTVKKQTGEDKRKTINEMLNVSEVTAQENVLKTQYIILRNLTKNVLRYYKHTKVKQGTVI